MEGSGSSEQFPQREPNTPRISSEDAFEMIESADLPTEIKNRFFSRLENEEETPAEIIADMERILAGRANRGKHATEPRVNILTKAIEEAIAPDAGMIETIREMIRERSNVIGQGKTADVFEIDLPDGGVSGYCIKLIPNLSEPDYVRFAKVREEAELLDRLYHLRVPCSTRDRKYRGGRYPPPDDGKT